jgi:hypothetical protein
MILEIGAVIAVLAILPGMGSREAAYPSPTAASSGRNGGSFYSDVPNQVFFDARSSRLVDDPGRPPQPSGIRHNELIPVPPVSQQRYVENSLDYNSQRALDAATRIWDQGDRLLPPELRVRRDAEAAPLRELPQRGPEQTQPSHYAPRPRFDGRY